MITKLRALWQEAFGDSDEFLDRFFSAGYSPERCHYIERDGRIDAALYWFDCMWDGRKLAYLYAIATAKACRDQGLCRTLLEQTHRELQSRGYCAAVLVPGSRELFGLYAHLGYRTFGYVEEFTCQAGAPIPLREVSTAEYAALRRKSLSAGGIVQEGAALGLLATQCTLYAGADIVLCAAVEGDEVYVPELLGNPSAAPGITAALGAKQGHFRTPGTAKPFAMLYALEGSPTPGYLGLALD